MSTDKGKIHTKKKYKGGDKDERKNKGCRL